MLEPKDSFIGLLHHAGLWSDGAWLFLWDREKIEATHGEHDSDAMHANIFYLLFAATISSWSKNVVMQMCACHPVAKAKSYTTES